MAEASDGKIPGAGDRGHLRAARDDREHVIGMLKTAFVRGLLDKDEFDQRVGQTLASRTYAELAVVTADFPPGLPAAGPLPAAREEEGWLTMRRAVIISACLLVPTALATVIGVPVFDHYRQPALIMLPVVALFLATLVSVPLLAEARYRQQQRQRRSRSGRPQAPRGGAGRQAALGSQAQRPRRSPGRDLTLAVTG
jgi:hypothetical protein